MLEFSDIKLWILNRVKLFVAAFLLLVTSLVVIYYSHRQLAARAERFERVRAEEIVVHKEPESKIQDVKGTHHNLLVPQPVFEQMLRPRLPVLADRGEPVYEFEAQLPELNLEGAPSKKGPEN